MKIYMVSLLHRATIKEQVYQVTIFFITIRPVVEYCVPVWHYALTKAQIEQMEAIQKRAFISS